jgi:hypothetical protein
MKTREKRFSVAGVLLTHIVLMVFVLGFSGCDMLKGLFGLGEEESDPTPPPSPPEPNAYLTVYVSDSGDDATDDGVENDGKNKGAPLQTVTAALERVRAAYANGINDASWPVIGENPGKAESAEIVLLSPVTVDANSKVITTIPDPTGTTYPPLILSASVELNENEGHITLLNSEKKNVSLLTVETGVTLTLRDITLKGSNSDASPLVKVNSGGNLILADNAVIYGHRNTNGSGGGVSVEKGGTFTMSSGVIWGNYAMSASGGGGVTVAIGGTFAMSGGVIRDNHACAGGGVSMRGGAFTMSGGVIRGNSALYDGGGVFVKGNGTFAKTGESVIYGNDNDGNNAYLNNTCGVNREGNAVCVLSTTKRNKTVGENDNLFYNVIGNTDSGWVD